MRGKYIRRLALVTVRAFSVAIVVVGLSSPCWAALTPPAKSFVIKNSGGDAVAYFDSDGNFETIGVIHTNVGSISPTDTSEYLVYDPGATAYVMRIDSQSGHVFIAGDVTECDSTTSGPTICASFSPTSGGSGEFIVRDSSGTTVAWLDVDGDLYLWAGSIQNSVEIVNSYATSDSTSYDGRPAIATNGTTWISVWDSKYDLSNAGASDTDIIVSRSTDDGATWATAIILNSNASSDSTSADDIEPSIAIDSSGNAFAVWAAKSGSTYDIYVAKSTDSGANWAARSPLHTTAIADPAGNGDPVSERTPHIVSYGSGKFAVVWDLQVAGSAYDYYYPMASYTTNGGSSWSSPVEVNSTAASSRGSGGATGISRPRVAVDSSGNMVAVWHHSGVSGTAMPDSGVYESHGTGASWSTPAQLSGGVDPDVAHDGSGEWVAVWEDGSPGFDVYASHSSNTGSTWATATLVIADMSSYGTQPLRPRLASDTAGNWIVVLNSDDTVYGTGSDWDVYEVRSSDNGATWSSGALLNSTGSSDSGSDNAADIAADSSGNWVAVWESKEDHASASTDGDIFSSMIETP